MEPDHSEPVIKQMKLDDTLIEPNPTKTTIIDEPWQSFKITKPIRQPYANEYDYRLLKNYKTSIFGDICIQIGDEEYILDRAILASKSNNFGYLMSPEKKMTAEDINKLVRCRGSRFHHIVDIIYGQDVRNILAEDNFIRLLTDMNEMELETDLEIFREFIQKIIDSKIQLNDRMYEILSFLSCASPKFDYLLPTVSAYFSDRLLEIYKREEFIWHLSTEEFILILLHKNDNLSEKKLIGRVCAEWICHDYQNRIKALKDLVNATKYRYGLLPYCDSDPNEFLQRIHSSDEPDVQQVEKYFNELLSYFGEVKYDPPAGLNEKLDIMKSGARVVFSNDQAKKWTLYKGKQLFCDVCINVQGIIFKLHRIKLSSISGYFYDLFTNPSESLAFEIDNADGEPKMSQHTLNEIDPVTFESIVQYIYEQKIEITSATQLVKLLQGSKFLEMNELFENCSSKLLKIAPHLTTGIFQIFQYVYENKLYSDEYIAIKKRIIDLWPILDKIPKFLNIPLNILKEIVSSLELEIGNVDEMLDLCSKWIYHDVQNRYKCIIELARAINRNFTMNSEQLKLEIPQNLNDYSQQYVKNQLIRILSSTTLVPAKTINFQKDEQKPCFLALNHDKALHVLDANFKKIIKLRGVQKECLWPAATLKDNQLFILYWDNEFYFQLYDFSLKKMIQLAPDARMFYEEFVILHCNDEIYYFDDILALKYSVELNRWVDFLTNDEGDMKQYTSDGKNLYKVHSVHSEVLNLWENKASRYDFEKNAWIALPSIPISRRYYEKCKVGIINGQLTVILHSSTFSFSWITQTWNSFFNFDENLEEFAERGQNILYIADTNDVYVYSPILDEFSWERTLNASGFVVAIHKTG